jgi:predicted TIM-barrel fold metal-dependent hydrolase
MIIDIHYHLMNEGWDPEKLFSSAKKLITKTFGPLSDDQLKRMFSNFWDPTGEKAIEFMDSAGIDKSTLLATDWGFGLGEPAVPIEEQNRIVSETARRYPDRLIPFAGIDPRRKNAVDLLKRCIEEWEMKGLKLHPDTGFYPDDESFYPLYEKVQEYKIPILSHTGPAFGCLKSKYSRPIHLDGVLADFPDIPIIAGHTGFSWWPETAGLTSGKPDLYDCLTGWQREAKQDYNGFCQTLRTLLDKMGSDRILFGTDGPIVTSDFTTKDWVDTFKSLRQNAPEGITFTDEEAAGILGGNAQKLLNLS